MKQIKQIMEVLAKEMPKPTKPDSKFKLELQCEECSFETNDLNDVGGLLYCKLCAEAHDRRTRFLAEEEEFNKA